MKTFKIIFRGENNEMCSLNYFGLNLKGAFLTAESYARTGFAYRFGCQANVFEIYEITAFSSRLCHAYTLTDGLYKTKRK